MTAGRGLTPVGPEPVAHPQRIVCPEAEAALIGCVLIEGMVRPDVAAKVTPAMFSYESFSIAYSIMSRLSQDGASIDLVILKAEIDRTMGASGELLDFYGIARCVDQAPNPESVMSYANDVREFYLRREMAYYSIDLARSAQEGTVLDLLPKIETMATFLADGCKNGHAVEWYELIRAAIDRVRTGDVVKGVPTGFLDLDAMLGGGLRPGEMFVIGARPSVGKSALALNIAENMAAGGGPLGPRSHPIPVGFFSLEMSRESIAERALSRWSGVAHEKIREGAPELADTIADHAKAMRDAEIHVEASGKGDIATIRAMAKKMVKDHGVRCIFIDYLQLVSVPSASRQGRYAEVTQVSQQLKRIALSENVPIVVLSQLNRQVENRTKKDKVPSMKDLRDSGAIEQDADIVGLLHRPGYYSARDRNECGEADLIVAKQRNGPTGTVKLAWDPRVVSFSSCARSSFNGSTNGSGHGADDSQGTSIPH